MKKKLKELLPGPSRLIDFRFPYTELNRIFEHPIEDNWITKALNDGEEMEEWEIGLIPYPGTPLPITELIESTNYEQMLYTIYRNKLNRKWKLNA